MLKVAQHNDLNKWSTVAHLHAPLMPSFYVMGILDTEAVMIRRIETQSTPARRLYIHPTSLPSSNCVMSGGKGISGTAANPGAIF